jgi:hypothetical protein
VKPAATAETKSQADVPGSGASSRTEPESRREFCFAFSQVRAMPKHHSITGLSTKPSQAGCSDLVAAFAEEELSG